MGSDTVITFLLFLSINIAIYVALLLGISNQRNCEKLGKHQRQARYAYRGNPQISRARGRH